MRWAVGARFSFSREDLNTMPIAELQRWNRGHVFILQEEMRVALMTADQRKTLMEAWVNGKF